MSSMWSLWRWRFEGSWNYLASYIKNRAATFQKSVAKFIDNVHKWGSKSLEIIKNAISRMLDLCERDKTWKSYSYSRYVTDLIFQQCNRPARHIPGKRHYFSGKHHLSKPRPNVFLLQTGIFICWRNSFCGTVSEVTTSNKHLQIHKLMLEKDTGDDKTIVNIGDIFIWKLVPCQWTFLANKGFTGLESEIWKALRQIHIQNIFNYGWKHIDKCLSCHRVFMKNQFWMALVFRTIFTWTETEWKYSFN